MTDQKTQEKKPEAKPAVETIREAISSTGLQFLDARKSPALDGDVYTVRVLDKSAKKGN